MFKRTYLYGKRNLKYENHDFTTPGSQWRGQICKTSAKLEKSFSLLPHMWGENKFIVIMSIKSSTRIVKLMAPRSGVQTLGWG